MNIQFETVNDINRKAVQGLKVAKGQEGYIEPVTELSLIHIYNGFSHLTLLHTVGCPQCTGSRHPTALRLSLIHI